MFRGTKKSVLDVNNFGAGSILGEGNTEYLVVCKGSCVRLMQLSSFELVGDPIAVEDPNFLSREEVVLLTNFLQCTMSDFTLCTKGLKK